MVKSGAVVFSGLLIVVALAGCMGEHAELVDFEGPMGEDDSRSKPPAPLNETRSRMQEDRVEPDRDVVVVAVVDYGFNPYHWDFLADHMPQHQGASSLSRLPLDQDPGEWLPGHPGEAAFDSYTRLNLSLTPDDPDAVPSDLYEKDREEWRKVKRSDPDEVHMHWIPDTKVIGFVSFANWDGFHPGSHGMGATSGSVGNLHGTCPECLFVFVNGFFEESVDWVLKQDWIDVQINSWGANFHIESGCVQEISTCYDVRVGLYAGSDTDLQREGIERGQAVFFSAGNGLTNRFMVPQNTLWSSQKGPDWMFTVGAVDPDGHQSYSGHHKPVDVSSIGWDYPVMGSGSVTAEGTFTGTSIANPVVAGVYARALWLLRQDMMAQRMQEDGLLGIDRSATGSLCAEVNPSCALADGQLHVQEMREALFRSAVYATEGWAVGTSGESVPVETEEMRFMAEGHGSFLGRMADDWESESERVADFVRGGWYEEQDPDQKDWMIALSWCRQQLWGEWEHGYWNPDVALPAADPLWPLRTWLVEDCPRTGALVLGLVP